MNNLTDEYGKRTLDFVSDMQSTSDYDTICKRVIKELEWFGYSFVTVWDMPGPGEKENECILLNTRPAEYSQRYVQEKYVEKDPVVTVLRQTFAPVAWDDVRRRKITKVGRNIIDEARDFGANEGFIIPILTADGALSLFSSCGREPNISGRARQALEMIGMYAHQSLLRASKKQMRQQSLVVPLTSREREVMCWVAAGKSDEEISMILNIGRETATTHVQNAKVKLNATRRTFAVVQALRFGEIHL